MQAVSKFSFGASPVVAIQTVVTAEGCDAGGGGTVGADVMKSKSRVARSRRGLLWVCCLKKKKKKV
jgi:hypothetical protein